MAPIRTSLARSVGKLLGMYGSRDLSIRGYNFYQSNQDKSNVTGGTIYQNGSYRVHEFITPGTLEVSSGTTLNNVRYLVVGGGGGGGGFTERGGGGGAGGLRSNHPDMPSPLKTPSTYTLTAGTYPVVVGEGGHARLDPNGSWPSTNNEPEGGYDGVPDAFGTPGYSSIFNGAEVNSVNKIVATGGGAGIWGGAGAPAAQGTGGSGGGCGDWNVGGTGAQSVTSPDGISPTAQGNIGAPSPPVSGSYQSGGGGGAGGGAAVSTGGKGGPSLQIGIRGKNTTPAGEYYAGGGQGTGGAIPVTTVSDPGGSGGRYTEGHPNDPVGGLPARTDESNGYPGTGGGGAGVSHSPNKGRGGPGIVIISYLS